MKTDLVIVGGGIVGASAALFASQTAASVVLLDSPRTTGPATPAAAGLLEPPHFLNSDRELSEADPFAALGEAAYRFYPAFLRQVDRLNSGAPEWNECGGLRLVLDESEFEELRTYGREMERHGQPVEVLSCSDCRSLVRGLSEQVEGGLFFPREARVDPRKLHESLLGGLTSATGVECRRVHVDRIEKGDGTVVVSHGDRTLRAGQVLVTAGAWTGDLLPDNCRFPHRIEPRSGEMVRMDRAGASFELTLHGLGKHILDREDSLVVGATVVEDGPLDHVRREAKRELAGVAGRLLEGDRSMGDVLQSWVGHRPWINRKGGPYLGPVDEERTVWVAAGHYRSGILQGPYSARLVVNGMLDIDGDPELSFRRYG